MSKHRDKCCSNPMMYSYGNYGMPGIPGGGYGISGGGYGVSSGGAAVGGSGYGGWGIRWIYALLILIVIVLQFGRKQQPTVVASNSCGEDGVGATIGSGFLGGNGFFNNQLIDNSVLFIIVVFLLILCTGCWTGGSGNYGSAGFGGGYGY